MVYKTKNKFYLNSDDVWAIIENGGNIDSLYPEEWNKTVSIDESFLIPGEKYFWLKNNISDYAVTSLGRIISHIGKKPRQIIIVQMESKWVCQIRNKRVNITDELYKLGINLTRDDIENIYMEHKWNFYKYSGKTNSYTKYNERQK